jgi:hypothetical protein
MTQPTPVAPATEVAHPILRIALVAVVAIAVILAISVMLGVVGTGPALELSIDPAGTLPF